MRIALATCRRPPAHDADFDFLAPGLRRRGAEALAPAWDDERTDFAGFDLVVLSSTWDYHERPTEFRGWLRSVAAASRLRNRLETVEWNMDKRYLRELDAAGVPTIPTVWAEPGEEESALAEIRDRGWQELVMKPAVDLGAARLARADAASAARVLDAYREPVLVQPYLPSLVERGELSIVFTAGEASHAVRKVPAPGDFRVQPQYGGRRETLAPPAPAVEIGRAAIAATPGPEPLYARADLVLDESGGLRLIELELIEPYLYLDTAPERADELARSILAAAHERN